jgi:hypothetical protein
MTHYWRIRDVMYYSWTLQAHSCPQLASYPTNKVLRAFTAYSQRIPNPHLAGGLHAGGVLTARRGYG